MNEDSEGHLKVVYESDKLLKLSKKERGDLETAFQAAKNVFNLAKKKYSMESAALEVTMICRQPI